MANFRIAGVLFGSTLISLLNLGAARATEERLGEVDFPISCSPVAQQQFNRAVAMLHSTFRNVNAFTAIAEKGRHVPWAIGIAISQRPIRWSARSPATSSSVAEGIKARAASRKPSVRSPGSGACRHYQDYAIVTAKAHGGYEAAWPASGHAIPMTPRRQFSLRSRSTKRDPADKTVKQLCCRHPRSWR